MSFDITGKLIVKYDSVQVTEKFKKREFVIDISEEKNGRVFESYAKFQCIQDRVDLLNPINVGDQIKVHFNIKGSRSDKYNPPAYFTNLEAWRIEQILGSGIKEGIDSEYVEPLDTFSSTSPEAVDDLPF